MKRNIFKKSFECKITVELPQIKKSELDSKLPIEEIVAQNIQNKPPEDLPEEVILYETPVKTIPGQNLIKKLIKCSVRCNRAGERKTKKKEHRKNTERRKKKKRKKKEKKKKEKKKKGRKKQ